MIKAVRLRSATNRRDIVKTSQNCLSLRFFVVALAFAFVAGQLPALGESYTVTGPDGNTVTVTDNSVSGTLDGDTVTMDEDSVTVNGHEVADEDGEGGGGGGGNGAAIVVGVVVVALAAVGGYFLYRHYNEQKAENARTREQVVSLVVTPHLLTELDSDRGSLDSLDIEQLASADVGVKIAF